MKTVSLNALVLPHSTVNSSYITLESFILKLKRIEVNTNSVECKKALWFPQWMIKRWRSSKWSRALYLQLHYHPTHALFKLIWLYDSLCTYIHTYTCICRAGCPLTVGLAVQSLAPLVHVLKCPWVRHWTPSCSWSSSPSLCGCVNCCVCVNGQNGAMCFVYASVCRNVL